MQEKKKDIKRELIEKGKKKGVLTFKEISDAFEDIEVTPEEIERLYDIFEKESIELVEDLDKELEEIEVSKEELEDLSVPEGINIDDHVKMYLKEIGKVNLLTPEEELSLAKRMADGETAKEQLEEILKFALEMRRRVKTLQKMRRPAPWSPSPLRRFRATGSTLRQLHFGHSRLRRSLVRKMPPGVRQVVELVARHQRSQPLAVVLHIGRNILAVVSGLRADHPRRGAHVHGLALGKRATHHGAGEQAIHHIHPDPQCTLAGLARCLQRQPLRPQHGAHAGHRGAKPLANHAATCSCVPHHRHGGHRVGGHSSLGALHTCRQADAGDHREPMRKVRKRRGP